MLVEAKSEGLLLFWTLNRPQHGNALGLSMAEELASQLQPLEKHCRRWLRNPQQNPLPARVLVIGAKTPTNKGGAVWIAGGDLKELASLQSREEGQAYGQVWSQICHRLLKLPIPVIMAIHGRVLGGGAEFALFSDLRLTSEATSFHFKQLELGLTTGYGSCQRLIHLLGESRAMALLLRGQSLSASTAYEWGLTHGLAADEKALWEQVQHTANYLAALDPLAIAYQKRNFAAHRQAAYNRQCQKELALFGSLWMNPTQRRYIDNFLKKP